MNPSNDLVEAVRPAVQQVGAAFMLDPETHAVGKELGLRGWQFYALGRGGVLGGVPAPVVTATFVFFCPAVIEAAWREGRKVLAPEQVLPHYAEQCFRWGREHLAGVAGLELTAELLDHVVDGLDVAGAPLAAGWQAVARPTAACERVPLLLHVLREHRGALHGAAVLAAGLSPLQAVLAGPGGAANAAFFGWPGFDDPTAVAVATDQDRERWQAAERRTQELAGRALQQLDAAQGADLRTGLTAVLARTA